VVEYLRVFHHVGFFCKEVTTMTTLVRTQKEDHRKTEAGRADKRAPTSVDRQVLIEGLNHDLAGEYQPILMYTHYSAKLTGPYRRELRALFQAEIGDELGHAHGERAYQKWEAAGKPIGKDLKFWLEAQQELSRAKQRLAGKH